MYPNKAFFAGKNYLKEQEEFGPMIASDPTAPQFAYQKDRRRRSLHNSAFENIDIASNMNMGPSNSVLWSMMTSQEKVKADPRKRTCMLYMQADHLFVEKVGSEEAAIEILTRHVQRTNSIYKEIGNDQMVE